MKHLHPATMPTNMRIFFNVILMLGILHQVTEGLPTSEPPAAKCPYHPCTPQRLGCQRLFRDEIGCVRCRCENTTSLADRPCQLHGCTVELLKCVGSRLKKTAEGCTLCQCEDEGATTTTTIKIPTESTYPLPGHLPIVPEPDGTEDGLPSTQAPDQQVVCPELECTAEELGCDQLVVNPLTGCSECICRDKKYLQGVHIVPLPTDNLPSLPDEGIAENPCPSPLEILDGPQMEQGSNLIGKRKPKYKLSIGKLKKGFQPGKKYKIGLKATRKARQFRAFLFSVNPAPNVRNKAWTGGLNTSECGAGVINDYSKKRKRNSSGPVHIRPIPHCPTQAIEADGRTNKSQASAEWTAPRCGCVYISVAVVDETNTVGYLDEAFQDDQPITTRVNRHLIKTVCAKSSSKGRKQKPEKKKSWITQECCYAAYQKEKRGSNKGREVTTRKCENDALAFSDRKRYRYRVFNKYCKKAYITCCLMSPKVSENTGKDEPNSQEPQRKQKKSRKQKGKKNKNGNRKNDKKSGRRRGKNRMTKTKRV